VFFRACGIPRIVGLPLRRRDLSCGPDKRHPGQFEWEAARIARRVAPLAVVDLEDAAAWDLALREEEQAEADRLLAAAGMGVDFLVLSVGTKVSAKDWTQPNWLALLRRLATTHAGFGLVAIGSADEATRSAECLAGWPGPSANLCGLTSPRVSAALLQRARLFLGHDSGPMHVAAAVGTACVVVFSARSRPGQWSPRGAGHRLLSRQVPCMGCGLEVCVEHGTKCLLSIPVAEVAAAVDQALGASTRSGAAMSSRAGSLRPLRSLGTIHPALK
jgi:ADP-heptose:LPS heptosyltransferase